MVLVNRMDQLCGAVSILILLDSILLYVFTGALVDCFIRFNPYSIGFSSFICNKNRKDFSSVSFNPYSIEFSSFMINNGTGVRSILILFQSLFYWILFFYQKKYKLN